MPLPVAVILAIGAITKNRQVIDPRHKTILFADRIPQWHDQRIIHRDFALALQADQMMMQLRLQHLELADAPSKIRLAENPLIAETFECPVNRRAVDHQVRFQTFAHIIGGKMLTRPEDSQDRPALRGGSQTVFVQYLPGSCTCIIHHPADFLHLPVVPQGVALSRLPATIRIWDSWADGTRKSRPERHQYMTETTASHRTFTRRTVSLALTGGIAARFLGRSPVVAQATPVDHSTGSLGWNDELDQANGNLNVATTVAPISSIVRNIGGKAINLRGIVPDGTNSHTFEPAPSDAVTLSRANIVIVNGLSLETPTIDLAKANLQDGAEIFTLGDKTITEDEYKYDFSFPEEGGKPNPHLWMNVPYAMNYARLAQAELARLDPSSSSLYERNLTTYLTLLEQLDAGIAEAVQTIPEENRKLLTYHDSWAYFADHYGMTVIGAIQPSDFSEPSPRDVANLIDQIRDAQVPAIFGSEVFPSPVLEQIAKESGATYIDELRDDEPPGAPGDPDHTYVGMMLKDMDLMIPALGGNVDALAGILPYDTWI